MTLQRLNDEANKKILEQAGKIEMLEMQKIEMRQAFDKVRSGKEKQLKDARLIFFAKRKIVHSSSSSPGSEVQKVPALAIILNNVIESENVFFASKGKVRGRGQMVISRLRHEELLVVRVLNQRCITTMNHTFEKRTN